MFRGKPPFISSSGYLGANPKTGEVELGRNVLIGAGATVIQCRKIADNTVIGAGAVVIRDITEPGTYTGVPARKIDQ